MHILFICLKELFDESAQCTAYKIEKRKILDFAN